MIKDSSWVSLLLYKSSGLRNRDIALSGMATIAINRRPGDTAIMAFAAKVTLDDLDHIDIIGALSHFEDSGVTDFAFKSDTMKPMREHNGGHPGLFGVMIQGDVAVFGL